ncbi:lytic transglycosylase domain-containing protein [Kribbella sp. NPDC059898]|uniref:lytic transglycosylase domain-containing protein n=1 Tax=Kribbella sp. NPDC059898 TaxID=3346995 RepID=UPI00365BEFF4
MNRPWTSRDSWRVKIAAAWACAAPLGAMVLVVAGGGSTFNGQLVVSSASLIPGRFIDLPAELPQVGADGQLATDPIRPGEADVPDTGTTDGPVQPPVGVTGDVSGIPGTVLAAYQKAARDLALSMPGCHLTWPLLAGIGKVESSHASGGRVDAQGNTRGRILGPVLNGGPGMAAIPDTDHGVYDGNTTWDRAVGPMQFIPGTWATFGADGNGDGVRDPHNVFDAARATGDYLCQGGADLSNPQQLVQAVLRYNHSMSYVSTVLRWMQSYSRQTVSIPDSHDQIPGADDKGNVDDKSRPTTPPPTPGITPTTSPTEGPTPTTPPSIVIPTPTHTTQPSRPTTPATPKPPYIPPSTTRPTTPPTTPPDTPTPPPPDTPTPETTTPDTTPPPDTTTSNTPTTPTGTP